MCGRRPRPGLSLSAEHRRPKAGRSAAVAIAELIVLARALGWHGSFRARPRVRKGAGNHQLLNMQR